MKMKSYKTFFIAIFAIVPLLAFGQNRFDALRFSQQQYQGTARSIAMGNAFTALGGDMGAITINPAASGVYKYSEFAVTPAIVNTISQTDYLGNLSRENRTHFNLANAGYVGTFKTGRKSGLINLNIGVLTNQTNNFDSRSSAFGRTAEYSWLSTQANLLYSDGIPSSSLYMDNYPFEKYGTDYWRSILAWNTYLLDNQYGDEYMYIAATEGMDADGNYFIEGPLDQKYYQQTTGYIQDITLNFGGNISNKFFFGINFNFQSIWYNHFETYSETSVNPDDFYTKFDNFKYNFNSTTSGTGFNMKVGFIYLPVAGLRLGASVSTPTWMKLNDRSSEDMTSNFVDKIEPYNTDYAEYSPYNAYSYRVNAPFRWNLGAAYTFGKIALLSVDYEGVSYTQTRFVTNYAMSSGDIDYFQKENTQIRNTFRTVTNIRVGAEVKPLSFLSIRGGYNFYDSTIRGTNGQIHYASLGLGYSDKSGFFADVAYQQQCNYSRLYDNPNTPLAVEKRLNWKMLLTLGFKF